MSGLIYYTGKRRVLPQLERTKTYIDTQNVTKINSELNKVNLMHPIFNLRDENLESKLKEWGKTKNKNLAGDIISQAMISDKIEQVDEVKRHLLNKYPSDNVLSWLFDRKFKEMTNDEKIKIRAQGFYYMDRPSYKFHNRKQ